VIDRVMLLVSAALCASAPAATTAELPAYWPRFPKPRRLYVVQTDSWPRRDDEKGPRHLAFTLHSLSGLAALANAEGRSDAMIWIDLPRSRSYCRWRDAVMEATAARRVDVEDCRSLIRAFSEQGIVKGYILYRVDESERGAYSEPPPGSAGYSNSVNVATSLAGHLGALIVEDADEVFFADLGLRRLLDARDKDERWCFETHTDLFPRDYVHVIDPKAPHLRDYAVATGSLCVFGVSDFTDRVYRWLAPNAPVFGWNGADEYTQTSQMSRLGHYQTAVNWVHNLPALSTVQAGTDAQWESLKPNARSAAHPLSLDWDADSHFTAFVMSDGDNTGWFIGNFCDDSSYWASQSRGRIPMGWTAALCNLSQAAVPVLAHLAATASDKDELLMWPAGYYYVDEYAQDLDDRGGVLKDRIDQFAGRISRLGVTTLALHCRDWDGEQAVEAYKTFAAGVPGLAGIIAIQYAPYNAGLGEIVWVENAEGHPLPVISARYAIWANLSDRFENNGPPALVASLINESAHDHSSRPEGRFDWTVVHAWSRFRPADAGRELLGEEIDQAEAANAPEARRGMEPAHWCAQRLVPTVRVVTPSELLWRARLHLRTRDTLDALAADLMRTRPDSAEPLGQFRERLRQTDLSEDRSARRAFEELKRIASFD